MNRKLALAIFITGILSCSISAAHVVTTDGIGNTRNEAISDAMSKAVAKVVTSSVDSRIYADKAAVAMDKIYSRPQNYVKNISIISEENSAGNYRIVASVDVDMTDNSALQNRIGSATQLNDPHIATVVQLVDGKGTGRTGLKGLCEEAINSQLLSLGFNHVVSAANINEVGNFRHCDYIVICEVDLRTEKVILPKFERHGVKSYYNSETGGEVASEEITTDFEKEVSEEVVIRDEDMPSEENGGVSDNALGISRSEDLSIAGNVNTTVSSYSDTGLQRTLLLTSVRIVKNNTKELITQFAVESIKMGNTVNYAEQVAVQSIGDKVAQKVAESFDKKVPAVLSHKRIVARIDSYEAALKLQSVLSAFPDVYSAKIQSYDKGKAVLDIDTDKKLNAVYIMLKEKNINVFVENINDNMLEISVH